MSCRRVGRIRGIRHVYVQRPCHLSTALTEYIEHAGLGSIYAYILYSSDDRVEQILGSHSIPSLSEGKPTYRVHHESAIPHGTWVVRRRTGAREIACPRSVRCEYRRTQADCAQVERHVRALAGALDWRATNENVSRSSRKLSELTWLRRSSAHMYVPTFQFPLDCVTNMNAQ